ncbi:probable disease resistance protein At4g27220 [Mangifera indica]|uniref:probable disease resistance protein At4g27220 n=1 Tax=Mangifera indica TaxID=29780 RepID=UPI001CFA4D2D|nr:probable disease resistance protein At4g27220 [Mangifera indica]
MEETAWKAVLAVGKCLSAPIGRQFMYLYNYKTNFHNLEKEAGKLKDARDEVKAKVVAAENNVEKIKQNVKDWQGDVDSAIEETDKLIQEKSNSSCFNLITRYKNGRKAWKKLNAVTELLQEKETFAEVSLPTSHEVIRLTNKDYEEFESRRSIFNDVLKALDDPEVGIIGVYGMGGIGKTTLVKEVGHQAKKNQIMDEVVFVEVSDKPDTKKIQDELAQQLGLEFKKEAERASKLYARLKNDKKVLVILDNIWEQLDLEALGIPCGDDRGGCKLLLTARDLNVLWSMDSKNNFSMGVLKEEEAWSLFKKMAGDVVDQTNRLNSLPNDVCNECWGLPIVITTIAKALRNKRHQSQWKEALRELKMPSPMKFASLLEKEYSKIALSYNYLKSDELKKTLLICSLMVNNTTISDLFKLIMGLDILEGVNLTMEQARNKLESLICELKESCLLLDDLTNEKFSMHDVVRSVVITIAYKDHYVFTERNDVLREWSNKEQLKKCTKISLVDCNMISEIWSQGLDYPKLEFFNMRMKSSFEIPEDFFVGMGNLNVLSFFHLDVLSLPTSLGLLTNLQTLCLDYGTFSDLIIIGELSKLKILSLRCCEIKQLPKEISKLTQLRLLDLSYCRKLEVIVPNVISSLSRLEELYMRRCPILWKVEVLKELKYLSQLTTLEIDISDDQILPKDFFSKKLERYNVSIGNRAIDFGGPVINGDHGKHMFFESYWINKFVALRTLKVNLDSIIWQEELQCFSNVEFLCLEKLQGVKNDLSELDNKEFVEMNLERLIVDGCQKQKFVFPSSIIKSFKQLQHLEIRRCKELKEIVVKEETEGTTTFIFPRLAFLKLEKLPELTTLCHGKHNLNWPMLTKLEVNPNLEKLTLSRADDLIKLLHQFPENFCRCTIEIKQDKSANISVGILQRSVKLEKLELYKCSYEEIFTCGKDEKHTKISILIKALKLSYLSDAKYLWGKGSKLDSVLQNLEVLEVYGCDRMINVLPSSASFENLTVLNVCWCYGLINLLTPSMAKILVQLREMKIGSCRMMTEIVSNKTEDVAAEDEIVFGKLKLLSLHYLRSLICFYSGNCALKFPSLEELTVDGCPMMKTFSVGNLNTPSLQKVQHNRWDENILDCESDLNAIIQRLRAEEANSNSEELTLSGKDVTLLWQNQLPEHQFSKVKILEIIKDESSNIPIGILQRFNNLKKLVLTSSSYEEIFSCEKDEKDVNMLTQIRKLELWGLFNLEYMWKEKSHLDSIRQNLEMLHVKFCHNLISIVPSSVTFENLKTLEVQYCDGLINLVSSSTAKSLVRLEELTLSHCKMMAEVVSSEGGTKVEEIVFDKLKIFRVLEGYRANFNEISGIELFCLCNSGIILSVAKLSPGHAVYHFLASYQNGKFVLAYCKFPCVDLLELAKAFLCSAPEYIVDPLLPWFPVVSCLYRTNLCNCLPAMLVMGLRLLSSKFMLPGFHCNSILPSFYCSLFQISFFSGAPVCMTEFILLLPSLYCLLGSTMEIYFCCVPLVLFFLELKSAQQSCLCSSRKKQALPVQQLDRSRPCSADFQLEAVLARAIPEFFQVQKSGKS